jgi:hypothetical protein
MAIATSAADVAEAHRADLATQDAYGVRYLRYWVDEGREGLLPGGGASDSETASRVHREAHGLVADRIFEVSEGS